MIPGEFVLADTPLIANEGRRTVEISVANTGDRPIQVGSHFHFFEVNRALRFNREAAFGMRLNVPAGTAARFEPGDDKVVTLVELGGRKEVYGLNSLTGGATDSREARDSAMAKARAGGFLDGILIEGPAQTVPAVNEEPPEGSP